MARGDHIFTPRMGGAYAHHGIDMGDNSVIDYNADSWTNPRVVRRSSLDEFARGGDVFVRDYSVFFEQLDSRDWFYGSLKKFNQVLDWARGYSAVLQDVPEHTEETVIRRAESRLGESAFDITMNNCEHFATWCKTGISDSQQVTHIWKHTLGSGSFMMYRSGKAMTSLMALPWRILEKH